MADLSGIGLWSMAALWLLVLVEAFLTFAVLRQLGLVYNSLPRRPPPLSAVDLGTRVGNFDLPGSLQSQRQGTATPALLQEA